MLLTLLIPYGLLTYQFNWIIDDAYISFRYSKNLAQGEGLTYNPGSDPPVEGYSDFLWVLAMTPFEYLGWNVMTVAHVASVLCGVILLYRTLRFMHVELRADTAPMVLGGLILAMLPPIAVWSTSGLATMPFALLFFLSYEFLIGQSTSPRVVAGGIALSLLVLARAEGLF